MIAVHPQYILDAHGQKSMVILSVQEFNTLIEELESIEDVTLYDMAKQEDTGERMSFSDYLKKREQKNA